MIHKKVLFKGETYWLHSVNERIEGGFNISPLSHYDNEGNITLDDPHDISYAVMIGGKIMRFGDIIGSESDLIEVKEEK